MLRPGRMGRMGSRAANAMSSSLLPSYAVTELYLKPHIPLDSCIDLTTLRLASKGLQHLFCALPTNVLLSQMLD